MPVLNRLLIALLVTAAGAVFATEPEAPAPAVVDAPSAVRGVATVATRHVPPFAIKTESGWDGIVIELLRRIEEDTGIAVRLQEMGLKEMLAATTEGRVDAAAAALTITRERERLMDFSHPFYTAGLGVAVPQRPELTWISGVQRVFSGAFLHSMAALLGVLALVGVLMWLAERRSNAQFQKDPVHGVGSGIWWSAVTMTTVGYGDKAPVTLIGRLVGLVWMFASIILISGFTAAIASSLTVGELDQGVRGVNDLRGQRVLTLPGSTSAAYLDEKLVRFQDAESLESALGQVAAGEADALVYDAPILRYLVNAEYPDRLRVLPAVFARQDYGIALPPGSPLREPLNRAILEVIRSPAWDALIDSYLGAGG